MGMPINSYSILKTLALGGESYEVEEVKNALAPFSLFAFILHDPQLHPSFHQKLIKLFERLDYLTGDNLLFFALADPPLAWKKRAEERGYYAKVSDWAVRAAVNPNGAPQSIDPSLTLFALMNTLGISADELPCILVTSNFDAQDFYRFPVDETTLEKKLTELGYIAEKLEPQVARRMEISDVSHSYDFQLMGGNEQKLTSSLAKTLSDALSFMMAASASSGFNRMANEQAKKSIMELYRALDQMKGSQIEEQNQELEQLSTKILSFMALLNQKENSLQQDIVPINRDLLEYESYQILRTASKVYELLTADQSTYIDSVLETTDDFSPGVIALSKVFEREANLSMVHWIRKQMGISLPEYYDKVQPGKIARDGRTDFNKGNRNGQWLPPGIGQSEVSMKRLAENRLPERWDAHSYNLLMERWAVIREKRNDAAHDRVTEMQALLEVQSALTELAQNKCFEKFYEMKLAYSGRTHAS